MTPLLVAWVAAALALLPLLLALRNLRLFDRPASLPPPGTRVSVLIPARDEAGRIEAAVRNALASRGVEVEVIVLDDQSRDATAAIVARLAAADARVRLLAGAPLPPGWAGKQRACHLLGAAARHEVLLFVDADVRLAPDAAALAAGRLLSGPRLGLVSGFPRQAAGTLAERLVVPWIHVLLLGYLPVARMRRSTAPAYGAACGQWVIARRDAYRAVGGHGAAPASRHDGLTLPRAFRGGGWKTDIFDGSLLAECRMYDGFGEVWRGFGKSAGEGMATAGALPVWTLLLVGGHVLPWLMLAAGIVRADAALALPGAAGVAANVVLRLLLARRLRQPQASSLLLHAPGALLVLAIQWAALARHLLGRPSAWRGRSYRRGDTAVAAEETLTR